ncbi:hypothetical protein ACLMJK_000564 [Lecanora helva]
MEEQKKYGAIRPANAPLYLDDDLSLLEPQRRTATVFALQTDLARMAFYSGSSKGKQDYDSIDENISGQISDRDPFIMADPKETRFLQSVQPTQIVNGGEDGRPAGWVFGSNVETYVERLRLEKTRRINEVAGQIDQLFKQAIESQIKTALGNDEYSSFRSDVEIKHSLDIRNKVVGAPKFWYRMIKEARSRIPKIKEEDQRAAREAAERKDFRHLGQSEIPSNEADKEKEGGRTFDASEENQNTAEQRQELVRSDRRAMEADLSAQSLNDSRNLHPRPIQQPDDVDRNRHDVNDIYEDLAKALMILTFVVCCGISLKIPK